MPCSNASFTQNRERFKGVEKELALHLGQLRSERSKVQAESLSSMKSILEQLRPAMRKNLAQKKVLDAALAELGDPDSDKERLFRRMQEAGLILPKGGGGREGVDVERNEVLDIESKLGESIGWVRERARRLSCEREKVEHMFCRELEQYDASELVNKLRKKK
ncbi:uncharacterized protein LOC126315436 [Schistocerca gregaria]|uniref:uncharacterized protein LOC126315436 n=1 Tax=Schistocerca gregaria TaxID=7010 RepID=UPI00211F43F2|nr:uncharacterized protein LOC126315436 [Schistocerca gregaria]